uniref:DDE Tnp4 domain-containing protein n=1 Tax=Amphilophus citrinellus TaxID=61819 RepID=A0A3Q0RVK3_AMPCI
MGDGRVVQQERGPCSTLLQQSLCRESRGFCRSLSTADSFTTIASSFLLGIFTVAQIVKGACDIIWRTMKRSHMPCPTVETWQKTEEWWNFPHCIGAPPNSGSSSYNYKGTFSIVLLAIVNADYKFLAVEVGSFDSNSDGGIFANSLLGKSLQSDELHVPPAYPLTSAPDLGPVPYVVVAEVFPMKPFLLQAPRVVENAFEILSQRWRVYYRRLQVCPDVADSIVKATCIRPTSLTILSIPTAVSQAKMMRAHFGNVNCCSIQINNNEETAQRLNVI